MVGLRLPVIGELDLLYIKTDTGAHCARVLFPECERSEKCEFALELPLGVDEYRSWERTFHERGRGQKVRLSGGADGLEYTLLQPSTSSEA